MAITSTKRSPRTPSPCKTVRTFLPPGVSRPEEMVSLEPQTEQTVQPISHSEPVSPLAEPVRACTPEHEKFCGQVPGARCGHEQAHVFFVYPADRKLKNSAWDTHMPAAEFCRNCERSSSQTSKVGIVRWICRGHAAGPVMLAAADPHPAPLALGRRPRPNNHQVARKLNSAELDRKGYGIPKDSTAHTKRAAMETLFRRNNIVSRQDLAVWYGPRGVSRLYQFVRESCHNHWYSHEHREAAQSSVRTLTIKILNLIHPHN